MAFLGVKVPHDIARLLSSLKVEGEKVPPGEAHITILYLGKELPIEAVTRAIEVAYEVTSNTKPFTVKTQLVTSFPVNKDSGIPIIARVESAPLLALRNALTAAFDAEGVNYDKKYPEYKPHVTLSYKKPTGDSEAGIEIPADQNIPQLEWGVGEMVLWGGDAGDEKLSVTFPFDLALSKKAAYRAFVRLAVKCGQGDFPLMKTAKNCGCGCGCSGSCTAERVASRFRKGVTEKDLSLRRLPKP
jgi:2'-5' RNA ligase